MPSYPNFRFGNAQKLKSRKTISLLFSSGKYKVIFPLCFYWLTSDEKDPKESVLFGVSVSKRKFKKAVDRNLLKRRIRESFRLNRPKLINKIPVSPNKQLSIMVVYIGTEIESYHKIEKKIIEGLKFIFKES